MHGSMAEYAEEGQHSQFLIRRACLGEARVDAARGDAVAVENNRIAVLQKKLLLRRNESGDAG